MTSTVWPVLHYDVPGAALRFLTGLGFTETVVIRDDVGDVVHAELSWPGGGTVLFGGTKHDDGVHAGFRAGAVYVAVASEEGVDAVHERAVTAGATVPAAPHRTAFAAGGPAYVCAVTDTEGNLWTFGTYRGGG
ncbi:glyoxalase [Pseudonocardia sp. EC080610-09]|uniref:VOC family protein n=1 Tax=unclassified Pseudonocardia TaxID=2619320 RepID=UPI0006CB24D9|nr:MULTISPECIES: VOC family protein [unclassified Pseudonocardia]ALE75408.1 glyoxalase [Pseudonocardia sp. EC080625-04]ALL74774.1 glyoxalase [Pseudonocardia sp. EC080610-09]ALL81797.1 glyoxalase [Pseudonocardia sp. EC080619-01]